MHLLYYCAGFFCANMWMPHALADKTAVTLSQSSPTTAHDPYGSCLCTIPS